MIKNYYHVWTRWNSKKKRKKKEKKRSNWRNQGPAMMCAVWWQKQGCRVVLSPYPPNKLLLHLLTKLNQGPILAPFFFFLNLNLNLFKIFKCINYPPWLKNGSMTFLTQFRHKFPSQIAVWWDRKKMKESEGKHNRERNLLALTGAAALLALAANLAFSAFNSHRKKTKKKGPLFFSFLSLKFST